MADARPRTKKYRAPVLQLVPRPVPDEDLLYRIQQLTRDVCTGRVVGVAWVAIEPGEQNYCANVAGEARRRPILTRGLLRVLDDWLAKFILGDE